MITTIENWQIHTIQDGVQVFTGIVVNDEKGRFEKGWHMRSSVIEKFDRDTGHLYTLNTHYLMDMDTEGKDPYFDKDCGSNILQLVY